MNRRSFLARCLSGAVLGMARVLPMPRFQTAPDRVDYIDVPGFFAITSEMQNEFIRLMAEELGVPDVLTATYWVRKEQEALMTPERSRRIRLSMDGWTP